ncbi:hypothetical protein KL949_003858 [Ogataea haglerorum]|nr:hypothetical protein KL913_003681 [Ogataea haglerorum]KAG7716567.1 hypothetical protein KL949_003858 [Ogataea haglerorum]KAG7765748.1 hypothetical protein KL931_004399 [Ogataea haglerorum]
MLSSPLRLQRLRRTLSPQPLRSVSQMRQVKLSWLNGPSNAAVETAGARLRIRKRLDELLRKSVPHGDLKQLLLSRPVSEKPYTLERATDRYLTQFERPPDRADVSGTDFSMVSHEYYNARRQRYEAKLNNALAVDPLSSPAYLKFFKELRRDKVGISRLQKAYFALPRPAPLYMQTQDLEVFIGYLCGCPRALRKDTFGVHFLHDMHQSGLKLGLGEFFKLLDSLKGIVTLDSVYGIYKQQYDASPTFMGRMLNYSLSARNMAGWDVDSKSAMTRLQRRILKDLVNHNAAPNMYLMQQLLKVGRRAPDSLFLLEITELALHGRVVHRQTVRTIAHCMEQQQEEDLAAEFRQAYRLLNERFDTHLDPSAQFQRGRVLEHLLEQTAGSWCEVVY